MYWIYLSPHFDDAAFSCGGLAWEQAQTGDKASIWTVCTAKPLTDKLSPFALELHTRWKSGQGPLEERKMEDLLSCLRLGVGSRHFNLLDCIYRRHPQTGEFLYDSEAALNGSLHSSEMDVVSWLQSKLKTYMTEDMTFVCPLALGNHVDHQITRLALEGLGCPTWYYQDFPYILRCRDQADDLEEHGWRSQVHPISEQGLRAWQDSVAVHTSQISTFWPSESEMRQSIADYLDWYGGVRLWKKPSR
jgi:hypothetical protein